MNWTELKKTNIFNDILFKDKLPKELMLSSLASIFKGKGDPLNRNFYREIKLLQHVFKLYKQVLDRHLCEVVDIDKIQYGFMPGRGTVDAVFQGCSRKFLAQTVSLCLYDTLKACPTQLGVWGGRALVGVQGAKPPPKKFWILALKCP